MCELICATEHTHLHTTQRRRAVISGDVLTGIITGLVSQGYEPIVASIFGVYLHGRAADIGLEDFGYQSLIASHIIDYLGEAYLDLFKQPEQPPQEQNKSQEQKETDEVMYI